MPKDTDIYDVVFVKGFRHWRTGRGVRPKNGKVIALHIKRRK